MKIQFSSRFIKLVFDTDEAFAGRALKMAGEPLDHGFDADENSMEWLPPYQEETVDENTRQRIKGLIAERNQTHGFKVLFMGDRHV